MKLSFWQFLGLAAIVAAFWYLAFVWAPTQDGKTLVQRMNSMFIDSEDEIEKDKPAPPPQNSDGWIK